MTYAKKSKGRAYFQIPSNKVDCNKRTRLIPISLNGLKIMQAGGQMVQLMMNLLLMESSI